MRFGFGLRLPDPQPSPVELANTGSKGLRFSSAWEKRAGAYLPPRLSARGRASAQNSLPAEPTNP